MRTNPPFKLACSFLLLIHTGVDACTLEKEYIEDPQRCDKAIELHIGKGRELAYEIKVMRIPGEPGCWIRAIFQSDENWIKFMEELGKHNKYTEQLDSSPNPVKIQYDVIRDTK